MKKLLIISLMLATLMSGTLMSLTSFGHEKSPRKTINLSGLSYLYHAKSKDMVNIQEEIWKSVKGYEGYYEVSNRGRVRSLERLIDHPIIGKQFVKSKILSTSMSAGYVAVCLTKQDGGKTTKVHNLVAIAFNGHVPNGRKSVVNHKDFNKLNNNDWNLETVTHRVNSNKKHIPHSSKYTGVCWDKESQKWVARFGNNGKQKNLGRFHDEYEAHLAYENALKELV